MIFHLGFLFALQWLLILILVIMTQGSSVLSDFVCQVAFLSIISFNIGFSLISKYKYKFFISIVSRNNSSPDALIGKFFFYQILVIVYTVLISSSTIRAGGLPLLSAFGIGRYVNYSDFGIPVLHGITNSLSYSILIVGLYQLYSQKLITKARKFIKVSMLILAILLVFQLHRGVLVAAGIQYLFLYLYFNKPSRLFSKSAAALLFATTMFGYLGDIRSGREHFLRLANISNYSDFLPTGFVWVNIYLTTPFINTLHNSYLLQKITHPLIPYETFRSTIPSFARPEQLTFFSLENNAWNVHSLFTPVIADFGLFAPAFFLVFGAYAGFVYFLAKSNPKYSCIYSIVAMQILLSSFGSLATHVSFVFQLLLLYIASRIIIFSSPKSFI